ncbi:MAG: Amuc_1100 family pilus-like protein [Kiritimatiellae bacterium]|nr:Amuc_1100 family pilus-like protein [Kiritimatiellia bacterium]
MKRHQIVMLCCGVLMAALCAAALWLLWSAISVKNAAAEERNMNYEELQRIYGAKVFPNEANISRVREDQKALEEWLVAASNLLHKGDLAVDKKTPASFKQALQRSVRELSDHPGAAGGKIVAANFYFGFDRYLGQSDSLPDAEHVDRLTEQLAIIEKICGELYAANIMELKAVGREAFDGAAAAQETAAPTTRRRRRRDDAGAGGQQSPGAGPRAAGEYFSSQRFSFEFVTRPAAFIDALNRLSALDLFVVVAEVNLRKAGDSLRKNPLEAGSKDAGAGGDAVAVDPASLTHVQRIVTDPETDPPVEVKLEIDVYSFEGV